MDCEVHRISRERKRQAFLCEVRVEYESEQKVMTHNAKRDVKVGSRN